LQFIREILFIIALIVLTQHLFAADFSGKYSFDGAANKEPMLQQNQLQANGNYSFSMFESKAALRLKHDFILANDTEMEFSIEELFIVMAPNELIKITAGKKLTFFSKTDEINPLDFATPEDYSYFLHFDKAQRAMANNLLQIDLLLTDTANLSFFYFPEHKKNKLPAAESQWSTNTQWDLSRYQIIQDENGQKAQTAAILSLVDFFGDWSVVAFYGQPLLPQYEKVLVLSPTPSIYFKESTERHFASGFSWAHATSFFTFRFEYAYHTNNSYIADEAYLNLPRPYYQTVGAIEYLAESGFACNLQYVREEIIDYDIVISQKQIVDFFTLQLSDSLAIDELLYKFRFALPATSNEGFYGKLLLEYSVGDHYLISGGYAFFTGEGLDGLFSQYKNNSYLFAHLSANL